MAENVPGDAIARLYGVSPQIKIGTVSAKRKFQVRSPTQTIGRQAPPARGKVIIAGTNNFCPRHRSECGRWNCPQLGNWLMVAGKRPAGQWCATAASGTSSASVTGTLKWDIQALRHHRVIQTGNYSCYGSGRE